MKEIGEFLKSSRINNGVSIEEAAEDLNCSIVQLENMEDGNVRAFKDIFTLKELVKEYGKYLGVEIDSLIEEFNDFMFEHTSKISMDDILEARKLAKEKNNIEKSKIVSPYTRIHVPKFTLKTLKLKPILITIGILFALFITIFVWYKIQDRQEIISSELCGRKMEEVYEFIY